MECVAATRGDVPQIIELYKQLDPDLDTSQFFFNPNRIWNNIEHRRIKYFVAREEGKVVAACYICLIPNLTHAGKAIGYIENVITDEKYRRKGIGTAIMTMAINHAKENNCYKVVLQSDIKKTGTHKFYGKLGFNGGAKKAFELRF